MASNLSLNLDGIRYKRNEFINTLDYAISAPTKKNRFLYRFKNTLLKNSISRGFFGTLNEEYDTVDWKTLETEISNKLNEWIEIWNINNQHSEFIGLLEDKVIDNKIDLFSFICNNKISELNNQIKYLESNIYSQETYLKKPAYPELPPKPEYSVNEEIDLIDSVFFRKEKKEAYDKKYNAEIEEWEQKCISLRESYSEMLDNYEKNTLEYNNILNEFNEKKIQLEKDLYDLNKFNSDYGSKSIIDIIDFILKNKYIPFPFKNEYDFQYNEENNSLIIDLLLPSPDDFYKNKNAFYKEFQTKPSELRYVAYKQKEFKDLFNKIIYKINLIFCHDIFISDSKNEISFISMNGWINHLDKSKGNYINKCITSIVVSKKDFSDINLSYVDPEICFKNLKGIAASNLLDILPIAPINIINKTDKRFVHSKEIINQLHTGINLTEMNWEDFEHLVRELFEKEFSINGGEVKITQASRDGGVDAIAFDPDPIRGGKIIIQAKRYNNIVGVSAVRDLYGTTLNEGANKGILVTTSNYGNDAYEFAKGKPITLLNGANLLSLLEKHGYNAQIKLKTKNY